MSCSFNCLIKSLLLLATCAVSLLAADTQAAAAAAAVSELKSNMANSRLSRSVSSPNAASSMVSVSRYADSSISGDSSSSSSSDNSPALAHAMSKRDAEPSKRKAPRFLGKRQSAPRFVGKRVYDSEYAELLKNRLMTPSFRGIRQPAIKFLNKREDELAFKQKRQDAPRFVGKRQSAPRFVGKRQSAPRFVGKRQSAPRFVGKRQSAPRFVGKRQSPPRFVGKRQSVPRFLGKRQSAPRFVGKRQSAPRFVGKRFLLSNIEQLGLNEKRQMAPRFLGKRYQYAEDPFAKRQNGPYVSAEEFIKTYRKSDPFFMGKRDTGSLDENTVESGAYGAGLSADAYNSDEDLPPIFVKKAAPRFLGRRGAPRFLGKRGAPRFLGKRDFNVLTRILQNGGLEDGAASGGNRDDLQDDMSLAHIADGPAALETGLSSDTDWHGFPRTVDDGIKALLVAKLEEEEYPGASNIFADNLTSSSEVGENGDGSIALVSADDQAQR